MADEDIFKRIERLIERERHLRAEHASAGLHGADRKELEEIEVNLDQCWDLLRQRRALREFGGDPAAASVRPPEVVERYQQ